MKNAKKLEALQEKLFDSNSVFGGGGKYYGTGDHWLCNYDSEANTSTPSGYDYNRDYTFDQCLASLGY